MFRGLMLWKYLIKRAAKAYNILDPFTFLSRMQKFSEPSEVREPIELLRAGILFHARGLINTKAIQHNLDWVWPYWVERQFDPKDVSFIPRAFSFSHVNVTHRNWTAVGLPDLPLYPIVDPRGLVTPFHDGWSIDFWLMDETGEMLLPSRLPEVRQYWDKQSSSQALITMAEHQGMQLLSKVMAKVDSSGAKLHLQVEGKMEREGWLIVALRPYNPEGVQFIETLDYDKDQSKIDINGASSLHFNNSPESVCLSKYRYGDVVQELDQRRNEDSVHCETGMATGALMFPLKATEAKQVTCTLSLTDGSTEDLADFSKNKLRPWSEVISNTARLTIPDQQIKDLYDIAVRTVIQLTADDPFPGPYTYKRFWYRDACFMINAVLGLGLEERCHRMLENLPRRQKANGYYHSQNGEWDSNGQVLWIVSKVQQQTGKPVSQSLLDSIFAGAKWIIEKKKETAGRYSGLLPPGFSAEHFGPNDYYYWDDFWAVAGLQGAARLAQIHGKDAKLFTDEAEILFKTILSSLQVSMTKRQRGGMPASPKRRMDAGAIGSLVADYPLQLLPANHQWSRETVDFLMTNCFQQGGFFQDIIHSGINAYLTLDIAQTLLRSGDQRFSELIRTVANFASPTGQWPEAIHPLTGGGCMGDGQHGWAAAEWILMIRNLFVREEENRIIIGSGLFPEWLSCNEPIFFGPTPTSFGSVSVSIEPGENERILKIKTNWHDSPPEISVEVPGYQSCIQATDSDKFVLKKQE